MRISKLKTQLLALVLAGVALASSFLFLRAVDFALRPETSLNVIDLLFEYFYAPASFLAFLCEPVSSFEKGLPQAGGFPFWLLFAMIQWHLIFLVVIGVYRHFHRKRVRNEPAA